MYKDTTIGVVVPAYNEEGFVGEVIETVPSYVDRVYAIDDASSDGTWREIREAARRENEAPLHALTATSGGTAVFSRPVVALRNGTNRGVGGSIKRGYSRALADGIGVVAVMNGDGQMDPQMLDRIVDPIVEGDADFAKGNRLVVPEFRRGMSRWRLFGNLLLTLLTRIASGYWRMMDPQNGYTAISADAIEAIRFETLYDDYGFCNDLLIALNAHDMRIADVAMPAVYGDESSSIVYSRFVPRLSRLLARRFVWRLNTKYLTAGVHPIAPLFYLGAITTVIGAGTVLRAITPSRDPRDRSNRQAAPLSVFVAGLMALVVAMALDMRANDHLAERFDERPHSYSRK